MHPLAPLLILFTIIGILGFIAYVTYTITNDIADKTSQKMQKKNIVVTKDGMKVGVKEIREESYVDTTQRFVFPLLLPPLVVRVWIRSGGDGCKFRSSKRVIYWAEYQPNKICKKNSFLVKAWNYSSWPAYKSRFWNKDGEEERQPKHRTP